jgi:hypothetical protein
MGRFYRSIFSAAGITYGMIPLRRDVAIYADDFIAFSAARRAMPYFGAQIGWPTPGRGWFRRGLNVL